MKLLQFFRKSPFSRAFSLIVLLGIAMLLKYIWDQEAVRIVGWIHGILFIFYLDTFARLER